MKRRSSSKFGRVCNGILALCSGTHMISGLAVIVFQIMLIHASSPYHDIGAGLWAGPVFFVQGVLGFICLCDSMMCSVVSFLVTSLISALMTIALTAIAAVDLVSILKCPKDDYRSSLYFPAYCNPYFAPRIYEASWGMITASVIQLVASICSVYICIRIIYKGDSSSPTSAHSLPYLYDEISAPNAAGFRGSLHNVQDKIQSFRERSSYSLTSTLPVRRSKSVDQFSDDDSYSDQQMISASSRSVNIVSGKPSGGMYRKPATSTANANSVYSVIQSQPNRSVRTAAYSTRSLNVNSDTASVYMKHTAV